MNVEKSLNKEMENIYKKSLEQETNRPAIREAIEIMKSTAEKIRILLGEAQLANENNDRAEYESKCREIANLAIALSGKLKELLQNESEENIGDIIRETDAFAIDAKKYLDKNLFSGMEVIFNSMGDNIKGKNNLEKLIDELEERKQ